MEQEWERWFNQLGYVHVVHFMYNNVSRTQTNLPFSPHVHRQWGLGEQGELEVHGRWSYAQSWKRRLPLRNSMLEVLECLESCQTIQIGIAQCDGSLVGKVLCSLLGFRWINESLKVVNKVKVMSDPAVWFLFKASMCGMDGLAQSRLYFWKWLQPMSPNAITSVNDGAVWIKPPLQLA